MQMPEAEAEAEAEAGAGAGDESLACLTNLGTTMCGGVDEFGEFVRMVKRGQSSCRAPREDGARYTRKSEFRVCGQGREDCPQNFVAAEMEEYFVVRRSAAVVS